VEEAGERARPQRTAGEAAAAPSLSMWGLAGLPPSWAAPRVAPGPGCVKGSAIRARSAPLARPGPPQAGARGVLRGCPPVGSDRGSSRVGAEGRRGCRSTGSEGQPRLMATVSGQRGSAEGPSRAGSGRAKARCLGRLSRGSRAAWVSGSKLWFLQAS